MPCLRRLILEYSLPPLLAGARRAPTLTVHSLLCRHSPPLPSFLRRRESRPIERGAWRLPSFPRRRESRPHRAGGQRFTSFPRRRESPHVSAQAPNSPSPYKGRGRRERGGRGYCGRGAVALRHSCVGRNPFGATAPQTGRSPVSLVPQAHRHSREEGTYPVPTVPRRRESRPDRAGRQRFTSFPRRRESRPIGRRASAALPLSL